MVVDEVLKLCAIRKPAIQKRVVAAWRVALPEVRAQQAKSIMTVIVVAVSWPPESPFVSGEVAPDPLKYLENSKTAKHKRQKQHKEPPRKADQYWKYIYVRKALGIGRQPPPQLSPFRRLLAQRQERETKMICH